jgi:hypothetical protein
MLAFLDGILEQKDAQDIANKIDESKFAADLMHRIRDLLRRLRLAAPSVSERGPGLDPNTVAEYLDNTLPAERVTDFEKVCLEPNSPTADIHLAEVAACHQVLTIVLGEPAEIDPALRDRIYQLPSQPREKQETPEPAPQEANAHLPPPLPTHPPEPATAPFETLDLRLRAKPTVPEYLREPRRDRRWFAITAIVLSTVCLVLIIMLATHQFDRGKPGGNFLVKIGLMSPAKEVAENKNAPKTGTSANGETKPPANQTKTEQENGENANGKTSDSTETPNSNANDVTQKPSEDNGQMPQNTTPDQPTNDNPPLPPTNENPTNVSPEAENKEPPDNAQPGVENAVKPVTPPNPEPVEPEPVARNPIGRFTSIDQILLRSTDNSGDWKRLQGGTVVYPQERLLALPTYRTAITLSSGLILQLLGGSEVELLPGDAKAPSGIKIRYGRLVINSVANPNLKLRVVIGNTSGTLTFTDAESKVGIVVRRLHELGANPETETGRFSTEIFIAKDRVTWEQDGVEPMDVVAPTRIMILPEIPPVTDHPKDFPAWISAAELLKEIDRRASQNMQPAFAVDQSAQLKLLELADPSSTRLKEVRWLAIRSLGYLGDFDSMVRALNDPAYKDQWYDFHIEWLREAVARDAQTAAAVHKSLEKLYGPQAENLYRMLWGYTNKDLEAGEDGRLVKNLDDDTLCVRVLAIWNLKDLTGKDLGFRPEAQISKRLPIYQYWKQRFESNPKEIRIKSEKKSPPAAAEPPSASANEEKP